VIVDVKPARDLYSIERLFYVLCSPLQMDDSELT
jgi:hypothetical protein